MHNLTCPACGQSDLGEPFLAGGIILSACGACNAEIEMTPIGAIKQGAAEFGVLSSLDGAPLYKTGRYRLPALGAVVAVDG